MATPTPFMLALDAFGNWAGFISSDGTTLGTANNEAQSAAAIAGELATVNSFAAFGAIVAGGIAAETQLSVLENDQSKNPQNQNAILGDYVGLCGDICIILGGVGEAIPTPVTQAVGHAAEALGTAITFAGIAIAVGDVTPERRASLRSKSFLWK